MAYQELLYGTPSLLNVRTTNLAANEVFTGPTEDVSKYANVKVSLYSSHASATDGLMVQFSHNGTEWFWGDLYTIPVLTGKTFSFPITLKFFRVVYTNGPTATTTFVLDSMLHTSDKQPSTVRPQDGRTNDNDFIEMLSHLMAYNASGNTWDRLRTTIANGLQVDVTRSPADITTSGTITAISQSVALALSGQSGTTIQVTGAWVGTLQFEGTLDGTTWINVNATAASTSFPQPTTTVNGLYRLTPGGLAQIRVTSTAWTSGTATITIRSSNGVGGTFMNQVVPITVNKKPTYRSSTTTVLVAAVTANVPFFTIYGSATKTIRVQSVILSGLTTTAVGYQNIGLRKYSTAPTGGTSTALTKVPLDSTSVASTATNVNAYTAAPTAGTTVGDLTSRRVISQATTPAAAGIPQVVDFDFSGGNSVEVTLRGTSEGLGLYWITAPASAASMLIRIEWIEE